MSKLTIGDRVKDISGHMDRFCDGHNVGTIVGYENGWKVAWDGFDGDSLWWHNEQLELIPPNGPTRTKMVTEIVEGVYGRISVKQQGGDEPRLLIALANLGGHVEMVHQGWSLDELSEAITNLTAIRDALQEQDK